MSLRVLVADDNVDALESLVMLLEMEGCTVRGAADGLAALDIALGWRPEVCILDLTMPRMDGNALAQRLRAEPWGRDALLIALTGHGRAGADFDHHCPKPLDPDRLLTLLAQKRK